MFSVRSHIRMRRLDDIDIVQRLATLAEVSGTVYPGLRDLCLDARAKIDELRLRVEQAEREQHARTGH